MKQMVPILLKVKDTRHAHSADDVVPGQSAMDPRTTSLAQRKMVLL